MATAYPHDMLLELSQSELTHRQTPGQLGKQAAWFVLRHSQNFPPYPPQPMQGLEDLKIRTRVRIADHSNVPLTEYKAPRQTPKMSSIIAHAETSVL